MYRIKYKDNYRSEVSFLHEATNLWEATNFGKKVFGNDFLSCEPQFKENPQDDDNYNGETSYGEEYM